jgi:hypothetical protein
MARRNRRRVDDTADVDPARLGGGSVETHPDGDWMVRRVTGAAATRAYRCPGCDQEIRPATPHVVAWPAEDAGLEHRRHWHTACWAARDRRRPTRR